MKNIKLEDAMALHEYLIKETGGNPALRDEGLLASALESGFLTFDGIELYPTIEEKGARLCHSLVSNHAFVDGNKRIGVLAMLVFFAINGLDICATDQDVIRLGLSTASGEWGYNEVLSWVNTHVKHGG
ncbi:MAG: type II toxin-antitoxin system death-on-curing family toxin [Clostridia bacterium]|nr:type II toxin-antitoxin system death-on-curing family toxin [Clostridia bacterium]